MLRKKDSEKDMEKKLEGAMELVKILNLDFGKECAERKTLVNEAISLIKEKVMENDNEDFDKIMKGARIYILVKSMITKDTYSADAFHVWVQECEGKVGGDCKESWFSGNFPMAKGMHGIF
jgi:hypothetical protein